MGTPAHLSGWDQNYPLAASVYPERDGGIGLVEVGRPTTTTVTGP